MQKLLAFVFAALLAVNVAHAAPSPDGAHVGPASTLTTAGNETWYIDPAGWAVRCQLPTCARTNGKATALAWYAGKIWGKAPSAPFNWYSYLGNNKWANSGSPNDPVPSFVPSPDGSFVTGGPLLSLIDSTGAVWGLGGKPGDAARPTLKNGQPYFGGLAIFMQYLGGQIVVNNSIDEWFVAMPSGWVLLPGDPNPANNASKGITIGPIEVTPPAPSLAPSKGPKDI